MRTDPTVQFGREAEKYLTSAVHADGAALAELVGLVGPSGGAVLDVGTGAGHMAFAMSPHVDRVVASDPTQEMLEVTAKEARRRGLTNLETAVAFAESLPFEPEAFEGVTCRVAAHHFKDVGAFLREVCRVLKPGGWFLLVDTVSPKDDDAAKALNEFEAIRDPSHVWNLSVFDWCERAEAVGLRIESVSERYKTLQFQDWMDRMSVSPSDQEELGRRLQGSSGPLREYLQPSEGTFKLLEMSLLAKKQ